MTQIQTLTKMQTQKLTVTEKEEAEIGMLI